MARRDSRRRYGGDAAADKLAGTYTTPANSGGSVSRSASRDTFCEWIPCRNYDESTRAEIKAETTRREREVGRRGARWATRLQKLISRSFVRG